MEAYGVKRNCCPLCGGKIIVSSLYQYSLDFEVGKRGKLLKRYKKSDGGPMEVEIAACENSVSGGCSAKWDADEFYLEYGEIFMDTKYVDD